MKIKKELEGKYNDFVRINSKDEYSKAVVDCVEIFGNFIDSGKNFEESERAMLDTPNGNELTGFMMGALISTISEFHERGNEIKEWWNKKSVGTPDENGVKNPAIITIK